MNMPWIYPQRAPWPAAISGTVSGTLSHDKRIKQYTKAKLNKQNNLVTVLVMIFISQSSITFCIQLGLFSHT